MPPERDLISPAIYAGTNITLVKNGISTIINASGGGGGADIKDVAWTPLGTPTSDDDEFRDGAIDASWIQVDPGAIIGVWTEAGDSISCRLPGSDSAGQLHAMVKPISGIAIGTRIETAMRTAHKGFSNYFVTGIIFTDGTTHGAGNQVVAAIYSNTAIPAQLNFHFSYMNNFTTDVNAADVAQAIHVGAPVYLAAIWTAANTFEMEWSCDGISWIPVTNSAAAVPSGTFPMTPTHAGMFASTWGGGEQMISSYDFFRVR